MFAMVQETREDALERFIVENNVSHFLHRLDHEQDAGKRAIVSQILLEEENHYCRLAGSLDQLEIYISKCDAHIVKYQPLIDGADGSAPQQELQKFVRIMREIRNTLQSAHVLRSRRLDRLDRP